MKLALALKKKKRLAGKLNELYSILSRENSRKETSSSKIDAQEIFNRIQNVRFELIALKTAIAKANVGIYAKIVEMEELKDSISRLNSLQTKEGIHTEVRYGIEKDTSVDENWVAFINNERRDKMTEEIQEKINNLQDEIDAYNGSTDVVL